MSLDNPVLTAENLWRRLVEHQPAIAAALALHVREMPQDWPQRELGLFRPEAAFGLASGELRERVEVEPYDTDWESCGACSEASDPCRYHAGFETGYKALHQPLLDALALDPAVTVAAVLQQLGDDDTDDGQPVAPENTDTEMGAGMTATTGFLVIPALDLSPGTLLVAVGPGASGKSTYAQTAAVNAVVCLDSLRHEFGGDAGDQSVTPAAVERQNALLDQHLSAGATVFLDSTNVEPHVRAGLVERARRLGRPIVALRFLPDLDTCLTRNALRPDNRRVPEDTLRWQHDLTRQATPDALLQEGFTAVHHIEPTPTGATMSNDVLAPERIANAVAALRKAQQGDREAHRDLGNYFPEYEGLVMQTDHVRYLELAARAGLEATHLLIMHIDSNTWGASVDTYTSDLGMPLASVNLGDYATRTEAVKETVRAATENGWLLAPEHEWADYDCGGGEIHIPIHARPTH
ncbi:AAA family ATPase [Streptomyces sp. NPDC053253]|uniref:AAA family ATPase n=1 Tax=Streptomyces sp. NPDC053253 TaxID=3365699 RepID=UPI0037D41397